VSWPVGAGRKLVALAPALSVSLTALFVLPAHAGGFRLVKWGALAVALAVTGILLWAYGLARRVPRRWLAVAGFVASAIVLPALSGVPARAHWPTALSMLCGLALFFVTTLALDDDDAARRMNLVVLIAAGTSCAGVVSLQAAGLRWLTSDVYTGLEFRAPGTLGNPNWAAALLAPLVPLSLGLAATAKRPWPYHAAAAVMTLATLATLSKGGAATLAAGLLVFVLLGPGVTRRRLSQVLGAGAACTAAAFALAWRLSLFTDASWLRGRIFLWRVALLLMGERPLTGFGLDGYLAAYGRGAAALVGGDPSAFMPLSSVDFAHDDLLQLAAECGLPTAAMFVLLVVTAIASARLRGDALARAVGAAVAALFVNGLADSPLHVPSTFALFFFLLGWLSPTAQRADAGAGRAALAGVILLGATQGVRFFAGDAHWTRGRDALRAHRLAVPELEQASAFLPEHGRVASQHARALAYAGRIDAAVEALTVASGLRFDFDDEILRRDLEARSLDRDAAISLWQQFSTRFPALIAPSLRLGALHLQANDRAAAVAAYARVLANPQPTARAEAARRQARAMLRSLSPGSR
jgi:hypothetical protein